jgi:hypothetical protein
LLAGVWEAIIEALQMPDERLFAWRGPAIVADSFEVGKEVRNAYIRDDSACAEAFRHRLLAEGLWTSISLRACAWLPGSERDLWRRILHLLRSGPFVLVSTPYTNRRTGKASFISRHKLRTTAWLMAYWMAW